jgi:hypothetical protein
MVLLCVGSDRLGLDWKAMQSDPELTMVDPLKGVR